MRPHCTTAPLAIADGDRAFIAAFRARHDPLAGAVELAPCALA